MPESKIIEAMEKALCFLNEDAVDKLFKTCIFHYLIEYIHPFYDGNGRLGRFILSYGISNALSPLIAFRISETIKKDINAYYKAFKTCNDQRNLGDLTHFLLMQLNMILRATDELKVSLQNKHTVWKKYEQVIDEYCDNNEKLRLLYSYLIQAALFSEKGISMSELEHHMELSEYKINKLKREIPQEMIVTQKKGNAKFYSISLDSLNTIMLKKALTSQINIT